MSNTFLMDYLKKFQISNPLKREQPNTTKDRQWKLLEISQLLKNHLPKEKNSHPKRKSSFSKFLPTKEKYFRVFL